jgi:hypothetical protein
LIFRGLLLGELSEMSSSSVPTRQFLENWFYDTLNSLFECVVKVRDLTPEVADELRRLVLRPNDIRIAVEGEPETGEAVT